MAKKRVVEINEALGAHLNATNTTNSSEKAAPAEKKKRKITPAWGGEICKNGKKYMYLRNKEYFSN